ncbi:MAG: hypothetical protein M1832_002274 [Thelocarpon impressellum]|nr:MAG: hypothetical protein M1832_002274 [Thelocarpon impressellum]
MSPPAAPGLKPLLIVNPNTNTSMTDALRPLVASLPSCFPYRSNGRKPEPSYVTAPSGRAVINNDADGEVSAVATLPAVLPLLDTHSGVLVACYSAHPLTPRLRRYTGRPVTGVFEASVLMAIALLHGPGELFGIVTTGKVWEGLLSMAVRDLVGGQVGTFAGVESTGVDAAALHAGGPETEGKITLAVQRLLARGNVTVLVLGCAGFAGLEPVVRRAVGEGVRVVDSVRAGVMMLEGLARGAF